ncbi:MAG: energy-coupling factor transporter transmembrane component T, partial [Lachnospiraceae bacterium]
MNDSTLGQYYPGESVLHRLDPRTKFIGTIIFLITLFIKKDGYGYFFAVLYLMVVIMCAKIPIKVLLRGLKPILFLLTATFIFQTLTSQGGEVLLQLWIFKITYKGIYKGATMSLRLLLMVLGAAMLSYTTTPNAISDGLERLLQPLTKIKIPVHEFAFMTLIAIKFIPILMEESDKIMKAQMARGIEFDEGTLIQ